MMDEISEQKIPEENGDDDEDDSGIVEAYESVGDVPAEEPPPDEGDAGDGNEA